MLFYIRPVLHGSSFVLRLQDRNRQYLARLFLFKGLKQL